MRLPTIGLLLILASNAWAGSAHPNLVAWYRAENNALDSSGQGYHGTATNVTWASGRVGRAASVAANGRINVEPVLSFAGGGVAISAWVNLSEVRSERQSIVYGEADSLTSRANLSFVVFESNRKLEIGYRATVESGGSTFQLWQTADDVLSTNTWHHVVGQITYGVPNSAQIWVDGVLRSGSYRLGDGAGSTPNTADIFWIGNQPAFASTRYFLGMIDEVMIFNAVLHPSDIRRVMQGKQPLYRY